MNSLILRVLVGWLHIGSIGDENLPSSPALLVFRIYPVPLVFSFLLFMLQERGFGFIILILFYYHRFQKTSVFFPFGLIGPFHLHIFLTQAFTRYISGSLHEDDSRNACCRWFPPS